MIFFDDQDNMAERRLTGGRRDLGKGLATSACYSKGGQRQHEQ